MILPREVECDFDDGAGMFSGVNAEIDFGDSAFDEKKKTITQKKEM